MKTITTSKGEFVVVDDKKMQKYSVNYQRFLCFAGYWQIGDKCDFETYVNRKFKLKYICKLSEATDDDASEVVDKYLYNTNSEAGDQEVYEDYTTGDIYFTSALDSLHSLLKSNNITGDNLYIFKKI